MLIRLHDEAAVPELLQYTVGIHDTSLRMTPLYLSAFVTATCIVRSTKSGFISAAAVK